MEGSKEENRGDLIQGKDPGLDVRRPWLQVSFIKRPQKALYLSLGLFLIFNEKVLPCINCYIKFLEVTEESSLFCLSPFNQRSQLSPKSRYKIAFQHDRNLLC